MSSSILTNSISLLRGALFTGGLLLLGSNLAIAQQKAVPGDYDGDGKADIVVTRPTLANNTHKLWLARFSSGALHQPAIFGLSSDTEMVADYDGDGNVDLGIVRTESEGGLNLLYWYTLNNLGVIDRRQFGLQGDTLRTGHFDNDSQSDLVAIRKLLGGLTWIVLKSSDGALDIFNWGHENDTPFIANVVGNGRDASIVVRDNEVPGFKSWFIRYTNELDIPVTIPPIIFGLSTDEALQPADMDGDGIADFMVSRVVGEFKDVIIRYNNADGSQKGALEQFQFGLKDDVLLPGNHFENSKANILALRRASSDAQAFSYLTLPGGSLPFNLPVPFGLSSDTVMSPQGLPIAPPAPPPPATKDVQGCVATPGTKTSFRGEGDLWKDHSEKYRAPVILMSRRYSGFNLEVLGRNGDVVARPVETHCCRHNGGRMHWWLSTRVSELRRHAPLTVKISNGSTTECRIVPDPGRRYE
jgi:hypothetical protein